MVLPTSSPSPLRNSPGFSPDSLRPHRGRTMHVTHVSTCDTQIATRRPPAPCRSRPISPLSQARRARGTPRLVSLMGAVLRTPVVIRFDKTPRATPGGRHHGLRHICHKRVELRGTLQHVNLQSTIRGVTPASQWHIGSKSHPVPHQVANPTVSNTSATGMSNCVGHSNT